MANTQQRGASFRRLTAVLDGLVDSSIASAESRVSSWPLGDPVVYDQVLPGEDRPGISPEEASFFKEHGFLVKVGLYLRALFTRSVYTQAAAQQPFSSPAVCPPSLPSSLAYLVHA